MKLDDVKKLHLKRYREEFGHFLVEGEHLVLELQKAAMHNPSLQACELYVTSEYESWRSPFQTHLIGASHMSQVADTKNPQGIVAVVPILPTVAARKGERAIYLHEIQDPGNLGTVLRTLAWFGNFRCLLGPGSVDPYNPKVIRASAGAIFHVPIELDVELDSLCARFPRIACLDMGGESVQSAQFKRFECYVFGNEARGVPRDQMTALGAQPYTIDGIGAIESLNLAAAVNMCVYELNRSPR
ncbi:MAG: RNA methyltransferase [Gammaproteobacteria bacterium]